MAATDPEVVNHGSYFGFNCWKQSVVMPTMRALFDISRESRIDANSSSALYCDSFVTVEPVFDCTSKMCFSVDNNTDTQ